MSAKTTKKKRRRPAASAGDSWFRVLTRNLTNMATVLASSGSVLLCLLIAKRFV